MNGAGDGKIDDDGVKKLADNLQGKFGFRKRYGEYPSKEGDRFKICFVLD
jgi:hypothetical protein